MNVSDPHTDPNDRNELMQASPDRPERRSNWVAITTAALGGSVLLALGGGTAVAGALTATMDPKLVPQMLAVDADGITSIDVDASAARFLVTCEASVAQSDDEFVLSTSTGNREWRMERYGDTLRVEPQDRWYLSFSPFGDFTDQPQSVDLVLPGELCGSGSGSSGTLLDADLEIGAGVLTVDGAFGALNLIIGAGTARLDGSARNLEVEMGFGDAALYLSDVDTADITLAAGTLRGSFDGQAPRHVSVEVGSGDLDLWLPDETYAIESDVSFGDFTSELRTDSRATERTIEVEIAVGSVRLHRQN